MKNKTAQKFAKQIQSIYPKHKVVIKRYALASGEYYIQLSSQGYTQTLDEEVDVLDFLSIHA